MWKLILLAQCLFAPLLLSNEPFILATSEEEWLTQHAFFQENGYIWIKDFFTPEQVVTLEKWADEMDTASRYQLANPEDKQPAILPLIVVPERDNPKLACRVEDMSTCYPQFHAFIQHCLTPFLNSLMQEPYILFKDKLNFKWPGGGAFLPHQDYPAYAQFGPRGHVTAMLSIDPATFENGCLQVAKKWQQTFQLESTAVFPFIIGGKEHGSIQKEFVEKMNWIPLQTSPRDLVLINSFIPHYSEPNQSTSSRRAMFMTYNRLDEGEVRGSYYHAKRTDPQNPLFHIGTPTHARGKD